jgi:class 3 adenylate cyclase
LGVACVHCGYRNSLSARFCGSCGASLGAAEGELKQATVMFADIVGSTELIAGISPEEALCRLQPAVETMSAAVRRFDGTVFRSLGDGIMALFGAPQAQEGHALLACEAALAIQMAFPAHTSGLAVRVGLDSGRVVSSVAGNDPTSAQGAHGLTVHLASRLQGLAEPGGVCLTEDCYRLIRPYCEVLPLGRRALKGVRDPIEVYSLLGLKPAVASQQFWRSNLTAFHGRTREIGTLQRALENIECVGIKAIGVSGSAGSGKSRLCFEFAEWCRDRLVPVVEARAQPYGRATPLQLVLDFLRLSLGISPTDEASFSRRRIARQVLAIAPTFEVDLPLIYELLGVAETGHSAPQLHPKARHARLLDVVRHIVRQRGEATSIILIEDLHWLDEASEDFIATVVDAVVDTRTLLVVNYRPGYRAAWMSWPHYRELDLPELSASETSALVRDLIGNRADLREIGQRIVERSGGNPFFAEELVRSLVENGEIYGDTGNYQLGVKAVEAPLPATVEAVIGARIDRLADAEKVVLHFAAIIGKEFPVRVLKDVAGPLATQIDRVLDRLCEAELIQAQSSIEEQGFAFRHPLIQEVAYGSQLRTRRRALHAAVAAV